MNTEDLKLVRDGLAAAIRLIDGLSPVSFGKLRTDRKVESTPALPVGDVMIDPVFGTTIKRVTKNTIENSSFRTLSSGYSWSADSKYFTVIQANGAIYLLDAKAFIKVKLTGFATETTFSRESPSLIYGGNYIPGPIGVVNQYDISTGLYKQILKLRDIVPTLDDNGRTYMRGINTVNGKLTVLFGGIGQDSDHYVYYCNVDGSNGRLFDSRLILKCNLHAINLDLSGRYVVLGPTQKDIEGPNKLAMNIVWDTQTDTLTPITVSSGGHGAIGFQISVNNPDDADGMQYLLRHLSVPNNIVEIIKPYPTPPAFKMASHMSFNVKRDDIITATYRYFEGINAPRREWDDEILEVHIETGVVERICNHHSIVTGNENLEALDYWATPKPCVSPDGTKVIFTSNWDRSLGSNEEGFRQDVFLVEIP